MHLARSRRFFSEESPSTAEGNSRGDSRLFPPILNGSLHPLLPPPFSISLFQERPFVTDIVWTIYYRFGQHVQSIPPYTSYRIPNEKGGGSTRSMAGNPQIRKPSTLDPLHDDEVNGWEVGLWYTKHTGQRRTIPVDRGKRRIMQSRLQSSSPSRFGSEKNEGLSTLG